MDLIRIFIEVAFDKAADRFLSEADLDRMHPPHSLLIDEETFVDECRTYHRELSDDQIRTIYALGRDDWAYETDPNRYRNEKIPNIFNVLQRFAVNVLRNKNKYPEVKFNHLFRWRETSLLVGEDLLVASFLAYMEKFESIAKYKPQNCYFPDRKDFFYWPTVLHNDNPHLKYIFEKYGLCELHSHLFASTDNFGLSWISLMNKVKNREESVKDVALSHNKTRRIELIAKIHCRLIEAASLRLELWDHVNNKGNERDLPRPADYVDLEHFAEDVQQAVDETKKDEDALDYIQSDMTDKDNPLNVIAGERILLFKVFSKILDGADEQVSELFYRYILIKNWFRSFIVQVNDNKGFANFKRFQDLKTRFITKKYKPYLKSLPIWEAKTYNYTVTMETRVTPQSKPKDIISLAKGIETFASNISGEEESEELRNDRDSQRRENWDWSLIFHFLKRPSQAEQDGTARDAEVRKYVRTNAYKLLVLLRNPRTDDEWREASSHLLGIDAASSEIGCRPEIFAHAFRVLKAAGYSATFHAGEDFYDLADGLRAIDEAIKFLGLQAGDRLGHALALGIDAEAFYKDRHYYIGCPRQWMLDNLVWLYYKTRACDINIGPKMELFIQSTFLKLLHAIGYGKDTKILNYFQSMLLRGDDPDLYSQHNADSTLDKNGLWRSFGYVQDETLHAIREDEVNEAKNIHILYLFDEDIKRKGNLMESFRLPEEYPKIIKAVQQKRAARRGRRGVGSEWGR
ncbi:MAG: hypothetical protein K2K97_00805, partial [Muribaculaceae bacterium]|nr:hypothetical protein [Muribaculaceae bacterium]